jgi:hypothetical protein
MFDDDDGILVVKNNILLQKYLKESKSFGR